MSYKLTSITAAVMLMASTAALADEHYPAFTFSGFGTVGVAHSSENNADFTASSAQAKGAGRSDRTSFSVDSRIAGQVTANVTRDLSAVLQIVSEQNWDKTWTPHVEWANVKYTFTPDFSVRLGRIVLAGYMYSDSRKVGYTLPWVRVPVEVYYPNPVTNNDGIDATYHLHVGQVNNTTTVYYGRSSFDSPVTPTSPDGITSTAKNTIGVTNALEFGDTTLRASYFQSKVTNKNLVSLKSSPDPFVATIGRLSDNQPYKVFDLGVLYDPGNWFLTGEIAKTQYEFIGDTRAWYVSGGYRFGSVTPYATYSTIKQLTNPGAAIFPSTDQKTLSTGVRWDFMKNADFKLQYDRVKAGEGSPGTLSNMSPSYQPGGTTHVVSAVVDFVF